MSQGQQGHDALRAADPRTSQAELYELARSRPELRPQIAQNPNIYPELLQWLGGLGDPAIDAAIARRHQQTQDFTQILSPQGTSTDQPTQAFPTQAMPAQDSGAQEFGTQEFGAQREANYYPDDDDHTGYQDQPAGYRQPHGYQQPHGHAAGAAGYYQQQSPGYPGPAYTGYPAAAPEYVEDEPPRRRRGGAGVLIFLLLLLVVGVIAAVLGLFTIFTGDDAEETDQGIVEEQPSPSPTEGTPEATTEPTDDAASSPTPTPTESPTESPTDDDEPSDDDAARPAPSGALPLDGFSAPSGNIHCAAQGESFSCTILEYEFDAPENCENAVTFTVSDDGAVETACASNVSQQPVSLNYGQAASSGDFACVAESTHFECWSTRTGGGFEVAREYYTLNEQ